MTDCTMRVIVHNIRKISYKVSAQTFTIDVSWILEKVRMYMVTLKVVALWRSLHKHVFSTEPCMWPVHIINDAPHAQYKLSACA